MGSMGADLAPGHFQFAALVAHDQRQYVSSCLQEIHRIPSLMDKQAKRLKRAIADALTDIGRGGDEAGSQLDRELDANAPVLAYGVALAARAEFDFDVDRSGLKLDVDRVDDLTVHVASNLGALIGIDDDLAHQVLQRGLLAVGGLAIRLELMQRLNAISGCMPGELPIFEGKLRALEAETDPDGQEQRFVCVLELAELPEPDLTSSPAVDVDKLLEARALPEAQALRAWLHTADRLDDDEIRESFHKVQEAMARAMRSTASKVVRFGITTAAGFIPDEGLTSAGLSAIDSFLIDRVIGEPGHTRF